MSRIDGKTTFGVIVGTRGIFNPRLAGEGRRLLLAALERLGYGSVILPEDATAHGAVETREDAAKCARLFGERRGEIGGIVVSLPNFGDEIGVSEAIAGAGLNVPVLVHAADDEVDKVDLLRRRDAFCGKLSVCNNLRQHGIDFTDTTNHTCAVDSPEFAADLDFFARVCRVVNGLRNLRVGAVGARPAAFRTVRFSEKILQRAGITVVPVDLSEIIARARSLADDAREVKAVLAEVRRYGVLPARVTGEQLLRQAKLTAALDGWVEENDLDATAVQCWTSIQENYGCAACLSMSLMSERLLPSACEVDVTGAVSMYALAAAAGRPAAFLDWNNNYGEDRDRCVNTHCSNFPKSFFGAEVEISELDILGATIGRERCFGAVKGKVALGPMTFFRADTDDENGRIRGYVGEGDFTDDPFPMDGGIAVCRIRNLPALMKHLCRGGYEHHVAMVRGRCAAAIEEAATRYLKWEIHRHE